MAFEGPKIIKQRGGLGRRIPSTDNNHLLLLGSATTATKTELKKLESLEDAAQLGISAATDATNNELAYHHISEFFRLNPNGTLYVQLFNSGYLIGEVVATENVFVDAVKDELHGGLVKSVGIAGYAIGEDFTGFLEDDIIANIAVLQEKIDELYDENIFVDVVMLEGRLSGTVTASGIYNLRSEESAANVAVVVAQDPAIAALKTQYEGYAAVGAALGMLGVRKVSENIGSIGIKNRPSRAISDENYPLTNKTRQAWLSANISSGQSVKAFNLAQQKTITEKGYIFAASIEGYPGIYFNDSPTCITASDDYTFIENNRVWNKAARYVREALIPKIRSEVDVNTSNGQIAASTIASWQSAANKKLDNMLIDDEISGYTFTIDPSQNVLATGKVVCKLKLVLKGIAREIEGEVGFENPFNN
jgi:hypothetical protein